MRLSRKQFLFLYPLALGIANVLAFLAVYTSLEGRLDFTEFAKADFSRWRYVQEHLTAIRDDPLTLGVSALVLAAALALAAAIRPPYYRAIAGTDYPVAPESSREFGRLAGLYAVTFAVFYLPPLSVGPGSTGAAVVGMALMAAAVLLIFADYALVFEHLGPIQAIRRSLRLLKHGWHIALIIYLAANLLWTLMYAALDTFYSDATSVFPLFFVSELVIEALVTLALDAVLVFTYDHLRRVRA